VDHAAHNNDAAALLWDQLAFDDAIGVVLQFAEKHSDTLIVITVDHGNANPGLNGTGPEYRGSNEAFERLLQVRRSFTEVTPQFGASSEYNAAGLEPARRRVRDVVKEAFALDLSPDDADWICSAAAGRKGLAIAKQYDKIVGVLGQVLSNHTGIGWTGTSHTSDYTVLTALGPGSGSFHGFVQGTDAFTKLCTLMDVKFRNPRMSAQRARQFRASASRAPAVHWA
jgi:alkaline phosphatase